MCVCNPPISASPYRFFSGGNRGPTVPQPPGSEAQICCKALAVCPEAKKSSTISTRSEGPKNSAETLKLPDGASSPGAAKCHEAKVAPQKCIDIRCR